MARIGCDVCRKEHCHEETCPQLALGRAAWRGDKDAALLAWENAADVNAAVFDVGGTLGGTCTAVYVAAAHGKIGVLEVLLSAPVAADPNTGDTHEDTVETPLQVAAKVGKYRAVEKLLTYGADPNIRDEDGQTPLMYAAYFGHLECIRALAEGAKQQGKALDVNVPDNDGETALDIALEYNRHEMAEYLRDKLNALRAAETPQRKLGEACRKGDKTAAEQAIEDGADVHALVFDFRGAYSNQGYAALHVAALAAPLSEWRSADIIKLLLAKGADPNAANNDGWTPCMLATVNGGKLRIRALAEGAAQQGVALDVNATVTHGGKYRGMTALDLASRNRWPPPPHARVGIFEAGEFLRDKYQALESANLPPSIRKPVKSARKIPGRALNNGV